MGVARASYWSLRHCPIADPISRFRQQVRRERPDPPLQNDGPGLDASHRAPARHALAISIKESEAASQERKLSNFTLAYSRRFRMGPGSCGGIVSVTEKLHRAPFLEGASDDP
jgi:hypothetical protein